MMIDTDISDRSTVLTCHGCGTRDVIGSTAPARIDAWVRDHLVRAHPPAGRGRDLDVGRNRIVAALADHRRRHAG